VGIKRAPENMLGVYVLIGLDLTRGFSVKRSHDAT
jgi:hypothetical protein